MAVYIIAEAGVNHNGRLDLALRLCDVAKAAGVDAVKFHLMNAIEEERKREIEDPIFAEAQAERFRRLEEEVRHNTEIQKEAYRAMRKAQREGISDDDDDDFNEDDYDVKVEYAPY